MIEDLNSDGFGKIHDEYRGRLVRTVASWVRDEHRAEDITSAAFAAAWEKREGFRGEASVYTWLHAIAFNGARQAWTRDKTARLDSIDRPDSRELVATELLSDSLERREDGHRLQKALNRIPTKCRQALVAHFIDGHPVREIARRERVPQGTVLSRIHNAKRLLRRAWETAP